MMPRLGSPNSFRACKKESDHVRPTKRSNPISSRETSAGSRDRPSAIARFLPASWPLSRLGGGKSEPGTHKGAQLVTLVVERHPQRPDQRLTRKNQTRIDLNQVRADASHGETRFRIEYPADADDGDLRP